MSTLRAEIRAQFPNRDEASDGGCASPDHSGQNPNSDHEPNAAGVARAYDYDEDLDGPGVASGERHMAVIAGWLRELAINGDKRVKYIIYEHRIASARDNFAWRPYTGQNAHKHHLHLSTSNDPAVYDSTTAWGIKELFAPSPPTPDPPEDDDMDYALLNEDNGFWFVISGNTRRRVSGPDRRPETLQEIRNVGMVRFPPNPNVSTGHLTDITVPAGDDD